jgi:uncharacterized membrane protein
MEAEVGQGMVPAQPGELETLQRRVSDLQAEADAAARFHDRMAWILYAAIFVLIPFVVVLFRRHLQALHYYLAGATFLALALVACVMDLVGSAKRDQATEAIQRAQEAYQVARRIALSRPSRPNPSRSSRTSRARPG